MIHLCNNDVYIHKSKMSQYIDGNQERMDELMSRIQAHHHLHGFGVNLQRWDCVRKRMYQPLIDGVLVAVELLTYVDFHPCGTFQCGMCEKAHDMSSVSPCYFDYNFQMIVCSGCNQTMKPRAIPAFPRMFARMFGEVEVDAYDHVHVTDVCKNENKMKHCRNIALKQAQRIAKGSNMMFLDGKSTLDVWHTMLAKRVIRRMKHLLEVNMRKKVAYVLYKKTHLDASTALQLVHQHL